MGMKWNGRKPRRPIRYAYVIDAQTDEMKSHPVPEPTARRMADHLTNLTKRPHVYRLT